MEKQKNHRRLLIAVSGVVLVALVFVAIYVQTLPQKLYPQEIREYQGQDLSSISDIRENAIIGNQKISQSAYRLNVTGRVINSRIYTYDEVVNGFPKYEKVVTLYCVQGWNAKILWEGNLVRDLLNASDVKANATTLIFHAQDGYTTSLPLRYFYDNDILMAYKMNGLVLPPEKGFPFQLVAESKYGYKWIKWITEIELSENQDYRGYWESRGYPNDANIP